MNNLQTFYLLVAIILLIVAILTYPTLRDQSKKKNYDINTTIYHDVGHRVTCYGDRVPRNDERAIKKFEKLRRIRYGQRCAF